LSNVQFLGTSQVSFCIFDSKFVNAVEEVNTTMSIIIVIFVILIPLVMLASAWLLQSFKHVFAGAAVLCAYIFGAISSMNVYQILRDDTVFMTNIHVVFTNKLFLFTGGYLGAYGIYMLLHCFLKGLRSE
jgi:Zn-dependent oligopeptidase